MIMADVLMWFLLIAGTYLVLNAYWLANEALFPHMVEAAGQRYRRRWVLCTLLGMVIFVPVFILGLVLLRAPSGGIKMLGAFISMSVFLVALVGSTGLCREIGAGLASPIDEMQPWRKVLRGGGVLGLMFVLPVVGWFLVLPWVLVSGGGALLLAWFERRFFSGRALVPAATVRPASGISDAPPVPNVVQA
jgi:hypothetical protein